MFCFTECRPGWFVNFDWWTLQSQPRMHWPAGRHVSGPISHYWSRWLRCYNHVRWTAHSRFVFIRHKSSSAFYSNTNYSELISSQKLMFSNELVLGYLLSSWTWGYLLSSWTWYKILGSPFHIPVSLPVNAEEVTASGAGLEASNVRESVASSFMLDASQSGRAELQVRVTDDNGLFGRLALSRWYTCPALTYRVKIMKLWYLMIANSFQTVTFANPRWIVCLTIVTRWPSLPLPKVNTSTCTSCMVESTCPRGEYLFCFWLQLENAVWIKLFLASV